MIQLKSSQEIAKMEVANRIVAEILEEVKSRVRPGVETRELDELAEGLLP
jgi:methionyl aminopeptidase